MGDGIWACKKCHNLKKQAVEKDEQGRFLQIMTQDQRQTEVSLAIIQVTDKSMRIWSNIKGQSTSDAFEFNTSYGYLRPTGKATCFRGWICIHLQVKEGNRKTYSLGPVKYSWSQSCTSYRSNVQLPLTEHSFAPGSTQSSNHHIIIAMFYVDFQ